MKGTVARRSLSRGTQFCCGRYTAGVTPKLRAIVVASLAVVAVQGVVGQSQRTFRTGVNYVRVDVYPTRNGEVVPDLTAVDFEVAEDGAAQRVDSCEFVRVETGGPMAVRREPDTTASALAMAEEARARVFVTFLDTYHVGTGGSARMRTALSGFLRRMLGPEDLVGVMAPQMAARDVALARRTDAVEAALDNEWFWGRRDQTTYREPEELEYEACYPERSPHTECTIEGRKYEQEETFYSGIAREMIERRREKRTLDALEDLVRWLHGIRDERKAVLVVSDGWRLFTRNQGLTRHGVCEPPGGFGAAGSTTRPGQPPTDARRRTDALRYQSCERDREALANLDNARAFRELLDRANRANVSFYPIDPRGLPVFDTSMGDTKFAADGVTQPLLTPSEDAQQLTNRTESLRTLAAATDGLAVVNRNDIEGGLRRIAADLTSYYLLGYYSSNAKLDGKFRSIAVRVKRPGVQVRARRGYLAATPDEITADAKGSEPSPVAGVSSTGLARALATLEGASTPTPIRTQLSWLAPTAGSGGARVWAVAEVDSALIRTGGELASGGEILATLSSASGVVLGQQREKLAAGSRVQVWQFVLPVFDTSGFVLRVSVTPTGTGLPMTDTIRVPVTSPAGPVGSPRLYRRGPSMGRPYEATADPRFARTERLRAVIPIAADASAVTGALLDRTGKPLAVPVECSAQAATPEEPGWAACELVLAPLAQGLYGLMVAVTIDGRQYQAFTAFRRE